MSGHRRRESEADRRERRAAVDEPAVVLDAAARLLEVRPRSVAEVHRRLRRAGYRSDLVDGAIARLVDLGMLDDEAFARLWVESRDRAHPRGERALREELRLKGVERSVIEQVLTQRRGLMEGSASPEDAPAEDPDRVAAVRLLERHSRSLARIADPRQRRQRAYALLARHGFDPETCREIAASVLDVEPVSWDGVG